MKEVTYTFEVKETHSVTLPADHDLEIPEIFEKSEMTNGPELTLTDVSFTEDGIAIETTATYEVSQLRDSQISSVMTCYDCYANWPNDGNDSY